ncbi:MAG: hypothetical protein IT457_17100 [Planctomycetes bacterium]|nr:hypothetical protein [Planctomycetota bacterium]
MAGIAGALESLLPRAVRARRDLRLTIRGSGGRITVAWLDVPDSAPVDLLELAIARFCFMGELTDRSARLLAAEFVRAVREGAEFLPGFEAVRERGADLARYALMTSLAQPVGGDGQLAERLASLLAMSPRRDAPPQSSAEIAGLVADLTTVSGAGEDEVREALRGMLARRARSLAEGDAARERCLAHARALAAGT